MVYQLLSVPLQQGCAGTAPQVGHPLEPRAHPRGGVFERHCHLQSLYEESRGIG